MILYPVKDDYLKAASNQSWTNVLDLINGDLAASGESDYGDFVNLFFGKRKWYDEGTGWNWMASQAFARFDMSGVMRFADDLITSVKLRIYSIEEETSSVVTQVGILANPFNSPLDGSDWVDDESRFSAYVQGSMSGFMGEDSVGKYFEVEFSEAMRKLVPWSGTFDICVRITDLTEPSAGEYVAGYQVDQGGSVRPYMRMVIDDMREQIIDALVTRLKEIKEVNGYNYTVRQVLRRPVMVDEMDEVDFPFIVVYGAEEERERGASYVDEANWRVRLALCVFADPGDQGTVLNRFIADIERALDQDNKTGDPPLGLDGLLACWVRRVEWSVEGVLDSNRAMAFVDIDCIYNHIALV